MEFTGAGTCVLDDEMLSGTIPRFGADAMMHAISALQSLGFWVLVLVHPQDLSLRQALAEPRNCSNDGQRLSVRLKELLWGSAASPTHEALLVAKELACAFVANALPPLDDWRTPAPLRVWLPQVAHLQVKFRWQQQLGGSVLEFVLPPSAEPMRRAAAADSSTPPAPGRSMAAVPAAAAISTQDVLGDPAAWAASLTIAEVCRGRRSELLLCLRCNDPKELPFQQAGWLLQMVLEINGDRINEDYKDGDTDRALLQALRTTGWPWASEPSVLMTAMEGRHAGLRAVGFGSNVQKRHRAGKLALALTAVLTDAALRGVLASEAAAAAAVQLGLDEEHTGQLSSVMSAAGAAVAAALAAVRVAPQPAPRAAGACGSRTEC